MATLDWYGVLLISDVNANNYIFHLKLEKNNDYGNLT